MVYVKFYTQWGQSSEVVSDSIVLTSTEPQVSIEEMTIQEIKAKIIEIQKKKPTITARQLVTILLTPVCYCRYNKMEGHLLTLPDRHRWG